jgi:hypothetical protein
MYKELKTLKRQKYKPQNNKPEQTHTQNTKPEYTNGSKTTNDVSETGSVSVLLVFSGFLALCIYMYIYIWF